MLEGRDGPLMMEAVRRRMIHVVLPLVLLCLQPGPHVFKQFKQCQLLEGEG